MSLSAGTRLGPYEIVSTLGVGGMGEVYRARNTKLRRDVAIKVLPDAVASDPDRLARFHREAHVLASLNQLNIAAIYGFEDADRTHALVMELVEGPTLADLIAKNPIPLIEAMPLAKQIAEALEAAHDRGIMHRDLKPANIKIRDDGIVKVLDFGLAKVVAQDIGHADRTDSPTVRVTATHAGVILGTAAYMSPEQARGKAVDKRSDVWAFGCVLYEMLTGCRPFAGESVVDVLASILEREPDWSLLPTGTPETLRVLLQRRLAKDPRQRLRDIGDARLELTHTVASQLGDQRAGGAHAALRARPSTRLLAAGAVVTVLGLTAIVIVLARRGGIPSPAVTEPPLQLTDFSDSVVMPTLSHDGRMLAFIRGTDFGRTAPTEGRVYLKLLPNGDPDRSGARQN